MSDPFDVLREAPTGDALPNVAAIKSRARTIQRRRVTALGGAAAAVLLIATIGVFVRPDERSAELASRQEQAETTTDTMSDTAGAEARGDASTVSGAEKSESAPAAPVDRSKAPPPAAMTTDSTAGAAGGSTGSDLEFTLSIKEGTLAERGAQFTLKACNPGTATAQREFSTSQRYEFEVHRDDERVWRWSDGRAFAQVVGAETWKPGECKTYTERWNGMTSNGAPAPAGRYVAVARQTTPHPEGPKPKSFCLDLC